MTIQYSDGRASEAVVLSRTDNTMRVALKESDDATGLTEVNGEWITENGEPVRVGFAWQLGSSARVPALEDCICPPDLAAKLLDLLFAGTGEPEAGEPLQHFTAGSAGQ